MRPLHGHKSCIENSKATAGSFDIELSFTQDKTNPEYGLPLYISIDNMKKKKKRWMPATFLVSTAVFYARTDSVILSIHENEAESNLIPLPVTIMDTVVYWTNV